MFLQLSVSAFQSIYIPHFIFFLYNWYSTATLLSTSQTDGHSVQEFLNDFSAKKNSPKAPIKGKESSIGKLNISKALIVPIVFLIDMKKELI